MRCPLKRNQSYGNDSNFSNQLNKMERDPMRASEAKQRIFLKTQRLNKVSTTVLSWCKKPN